MEQNRFFRFLWRANAVFLFVAGIGLIGLLMVAGAFLMSDLRYEDTPPPLLDASNSAPVEEDFRITSSKKGYRGIRDVDNFAYFELKYGTDSYGKLSSGSSSQTLNVAVLNLATNEIKWMFPKAQQEIEYMIGVEKTVTLNDEKTDRVTVGHILIVATSLSDKTITRDLWFMRPDGSDFRKAMTDIPKRPDIEYYDRNLVKLIMETDNGLDIYPLDIDTLTLGPVTKISLP